MIMGKDFSGAAYTSPSNVYMAMGSQFAGECTTYAWGRAYEKIGYNKMKNLPNAAAGNWYNASHGYAKSQTPQANSIGCFSGHVVFVERVSGDNNTIYFSEANWYADSRLSNGRWEPDPSGTDGESKSLTVAKFKERSGGGTFQGFIQLG